MKSYEQQQQRRTAKCSLKKTICHIIQDDLEGLQGLYATI